MPPASRAPTATPGLPLSGALRAPEGTPLYVHLPFCVVKCTYCDFYSVVADGHDRAAFVERLLAEADVRAPRAPRTVFLGGGTPSLLDEAELARLLEGLDARTGFRASSLETTVECNPESLTPAKARLLRELGVDRLSIGVQSLEAEVLALFGRPHGPEDGLRALETAREAGFERVSADLIHAVPGQRLERWERDLERVLALGPDHVSAYALAFEEGTTFSRWLREGRLERLPEERELAFFEATRARLEAAGLPPYEVSNFASDDQRCRHNVNYWENGAYVGLGPSAVSHLAAVRFGNPRSLAAWAAGVDASGRATGWEERLPPLGRLGETWWLGLRTRDGLAPDAARARAGYPGAGASLGDRAGGEAGDERGEDPAERLAARLGAEGWLERTPAGRWRLSARGWPLADALSARFLDLGEEPTPRARPLAAGG